MDFHCLSISYLNISDEITSILVVVCHTSCNIQKEGFRWISIILVIAQFPSIPFVLLGSPRKSIIESLIEHLRQFSLRYVDQICAFVYFLYSIFCTLI